MKVSELYADRRPVKIAVGSQFVSIEYAPTALTPNTLSRMAQTQKVQNAAMQATALVKLVKDIIISWDIEEDPPEMADGEDPEEYQARLEEWHQTGPHILPLTMTGIGSLPIAVLIVLLEAIYQDIKQPGEAIPART